MYLPEKNKFDNFKQSFQQKNDNQNNQINQSKELKPAVEKLISAFEIQKNKEWQDPKSPKIHVSTTISKMAFLYEKIRIAIDYKDEHLLRKNAIERILTRWLNQGKIETFNIRSLIVELIRAGYLKNDTVPESLVERVEKIFAKYIKLMRQSSFLEKGQKRFEFNEWILSMASVEIEQAFFPPHKQQALIEFAYSVLKDKVYIQEEVSEQVKNTQLYIAIHRALMKSDDAIIRHSLLQLYYPEWTINDDNIINEVANNLKSLKKAIEKQIDNPIAGPIFRQVKKYIIILTILKDIIKHNKEKARSILTKPDLLNQHIKRACRFRYKKAKEKLKRSTLRAVIYIILTKTVLAFVLELPFDVLAYNTIHYPALITNVFFHPILLIFIAASIKIPTKKNTAQVIKAINSLVYEREKEFKFEHFKKPIKYRAKWNVIFNILYFIVFSISFGLIVYILRLFNFNAVSIFLFLLFLSLVSFFGIKSRETTRELIIVEKKKTVIGALIDFFSIPIIRMGRWLSLKAPKINIFAFVLDFIIEAPFKTLVEVLDQWMNFIREKKEEIY
ncbi:MAG: hypothetical protein U5L76_05220 [Patescibacteria group bacterium]|nr:hypothetical protein [Patescibacteria group bacterium]